MANGNGAQADVINKSVTAADYNATPASSGIMHFMLPSIGASADLPGFWSYARDWTLYSTIYRESMWASAVYLAVTKQASKSWEVESDIPKRQKDAQQLFLHFDGGRGWVSGISKHLQAYLLTGNGGPVEIVRATGAPGAKVLGLVPLDPFRTIRTGNIAIPYLYRDRNGREHEMRDYDCFCITDQPDMMDLWYGVGHCAAERSYKAIQKLEAIERYIYEKVSGNRALSLDFISGVIPDQIRQAQDTARQESAAKGVYTYLGSTIIALAGDQAPVHVRINLAELPDGFERKEEFDIAILTYARSIGIPVQDLQPLSGQGLGTGAQTQVLEESAKGQGLATWGKAFSHVVNEFAIDDKTTFYFRENDIRDREREAKLRIDEGTAIKTWVEMQAITIEQARQIGVDRDQLPAEFIPQDTTPGGTLSDSEKPVEASEVTPEDTEVPVEQETEQTAPVVASDAILKNARDIYNAIAGGNTGLTTHKEAPQPDMTDSVRKMIDISWRRVEEPEFMAADIALMRLQMEESASVKDVETLKDTLDAIRNGELSRADTDIRALRNTMAELRNAQSTQGQSLTTLHKSLKSLADKEPVIVTNADSAVMSAVANDAATQAAMQAAELMQASYKHAGDLTIKQEIIETDKNGLSSKVRRTLADGSTQDFRVTRNGSGRIKSLEKI